MMTSRNLVTSEPTPRDPQQSHITRRQPAEPAPAPPRTDDLTVSYHVTVDDDIATIHLRAYDGHTGEIVRSQTHEVYYNADHSRKAREFKTKFIDGLAADGYTVRNTKGEPRK